MANHLKMADVQAILALRARGWSFRRISRDLGIHRDTIARHIRLAEAADLPTGGENRPNPPPGSTDQNQPNPPTGSDGQSRPNPPTGPDDQTGPNPPAGNSGPVSRCEPFRDIIIAALERGLSYQRIWQDLHEDGFAGGYDAVKRYARRAPGAIRVHR